MSVLFLPAGIQKMSPHPSVLSAAWLGFPCGPGSVRVWKHCHGFSYSLPIWDSTNSSLQGSVLFALCYLSPFFPSPPSMSHLLEDPRDIAQAGLGLVASRFLGAGGGPRGVHTARWDQCVSWIIKCPVVSGVGAGKSLGLERVSLTHWIMWGFTSGVFHLSLFLYLGLHSC